MALASYFHLLTNFAITQWKVKNVHDNSYLIEWTLGEAPPLFFCLYGPIRPEAPVRLLPSEQEWIITKGEGKNVYRWVTLGHLLLTAQTLTKTNGHLRVSPAGEMIGVNWAVDMGGDNEVRSH